MRISWTFLHDKINMHYSKWFLYDLRYGFDGFHRSAIKRLLFFIVLFPLFFVPENLYLIQYSTAHQKQFDNRFLFCISVSL